MSVFPLPPRKPAMRTRGMLMASQHVDEAARAFFRALLAARAVLQLVAVEHALHHGLVDRLVLEARAAARINHPNITTVHNVGQEDNHHFIVMEFVDGRSLRDLLEDEEKLDPPEGLRIIAEVTEALQAA